MRLTISPIIFFLFGSSAKGISLLSSAPDIQGDIHGLPVNPLSQRGVHGSSLHQIHLGYPKDFFNSMFHSEKVKDPHRAIEFNEEVNIASLSRLIPDN